jgi:hypothetical protein
MFNLQETSLEWSLLHVTNFYDSDFFPRLFEFEAIKRDWDNIKTHLLNLDIETLAPKNPVILLALKPNKNFRVVHQLDPIDSIIYTALLYELSANIESYRIPEIRKIACSYRIKPNTNGSFFDVTNQGYHDYIQRAEELSIQHSKGVVLTCDIVDFYNQIYLHRVNNILSEAGLKTGKVLENFLKGLNTNVSRGIPVGPAPSILIAEAIMADIDKKILSHTSSFTRYVDDIYIFFDNEYDAHSFLHELTKYLYSNHRLVLSSDKTRIVSVEVFKNKFLQEEERIEKNAIKVKLESLKNENYPSPEEIPDFEELENPEKLNIRSEIYSDLFNESLSFETIDLGLLRHILRQSGKYNIRHLIPKIFDNINKLFPVIREVVLYFERVLNKNIIQNYEKQFNDLLKNPYLDLPFINMWIYTLFQNENFNNISLDIDYKKIHRIRERALIAKREKNLIWLKEIKDGLDTLGVWDRRAVIYSSIILSEDEIKHWLGLESSKGDILNKALCSMIINEKKNIKTKIVK